ncbi:transposase, partial [Candidatus Peregrinibacteria bacterium]|nr:transposase [Candidatus Peregrinibacteria bacterium]
LTNKGELRFMLYDRTFTAPLCIDFLKRLVKHRKRKPFVILDRHPVHRSWR